MNFLRKIILNLVIIAGSTSYAQYFEKLKESADKYFILLSENNSADRVELDNLGKILFSPIDEETLSPKYQTSINDLDSLRNHFKEYESVLKDISQDSALALFNQWYLHLSNTFYNYAEEKFFSSDKIKLLLFSALVSCACTLEMCRKQTIDLIKFARQNGYDFWIVDSYENNQLQIEYETLFSPSLIVFDSNNKVIYKIEYDENMIIKLAEYLNQITNQKRG
jgi:cell division protein FtsL